MVLEWQEKRVGMKKSSTKSLTVCIGSSHPVGFVAHVWVSRHGERARGLAGHTVVCGAGVGVSAARHVAVLVLMPHRLVLVDVTVVVVVVLVVDLAALALLHQKLMLAQLPLTLQLLLLELPLLLLTLQLLLMLAFHLAVLLLTKLKLLPTLLFALVLLTQLSLTVLFAFLLLLQLLLTLRFTFLLLTQLLTHFFDSLLLTQRVLAIFIEPSLLTRLLFALLFVTLMLLLPLLLAVRLLKQLWALVAAGERAVWLAVLAKRPTSSVCRARGCAVSGRGVSVALFWTGQCRAWLGAAERRRVGTGIGSLIVALFLGVRGDGGGGGAPVAAAAVAAAPRRGVGSSLRRLWGWLDKLGQVKLFCFSVVCKPAVWLAVLANASARSVCPARLGGTDASVAAVAAVGERSVVALSRGGEGSARPRLSGGIFVGLAIAL